MNKKLRFILLIACSFLVALTGTGSIVYAIQNPNEDNVIYAAYQKNNGMLRIEDVRIGLGAFVTPYYYSGSMALSKIYNCALSSEEINAIYRAERGWFNS